MYLAQVIAAAIIGSAAYRLRGGGFSNLSRKYGWEWGGKQRTQTMRLLWSLPTGLLLYFLAGGPWYIAPLLVVSVFASMALWGHGAHMVFDNKQFIAFSKPKTENLTEWWLPQAFGGIPELSWPAWKITSYNLAGMAFIGLIRNLTAILPLSAVNEWGALIYALTGLLHGPLYWLGWKIKPTQDTGEVLVGAVTWASIVLIFA